MKNMWKNSYNSRNELIKDADDSSPKIHKWQHDHMKKYLRCSKTQSVHLQTSQWDEDPDTRNLKEQLQHPFSSSEHVLSTHTAQPSTAYNPSSKGPGDLFCPPPSLAHVSFTATDTHIQKTIIKVNIPKKNPQEVTVLPFAISMQWDYRHRR